MTQPYLELRTREREALTAFADAIADRREEIVEEVLSELTDAEELQELLGGPGLSARLRVALNEYLDALAHDPDGEYLDLRISQFRENAAAGVPYASLVVAFRALQRVLTSWNRRIHSDDAAIDEVRDALLRLDAIHIAATATAYLEGKEDTIRAQQEAMLSLSAPVVEIWEGILALPLVGTIDTGRARHITQNLLRNLRDTHARVVILDISGVPLVDTNVANHLMKTTAAARLLGAHSMIVGISPEIASTLVSLDIDFEGIETYYSLRQGLQAALARFGLGTGEGDGKRSALESALASVGQQPPAPGEQR